MREVKHYKGVSGFFDTHAHLYDDRFEEEGQSPEMVLLRASEAGVSRILIPADSVESSKKAIDYVKKYDRTGGVELFCSVGIHPHEAKDYNDEAEKYLRDVLSRRDELKIKAIGEIGLDYYYDLSPRDVQKEVFARQLDLCYELDIPFILHERDAAGDTVDILKDFYSRGRMRENPGVCHCCSCSVETSKTLLDLGMYLGFDGPLTFKNNKKTPEVAANAPLDRIVIETDSPYLTPEPNRGLRNEPEFVPYVAVKLADVKNLTVEEIMQITSQNALNLYEIKE